MVQSFTGCQSAGPPSLSHTSREGGALLEASMALPPCSCEPMSCSHSARDSPDAHVRHGGIQAAVHTVGPTPHRQLLAHGAPDGLPSARQSRQLLLELHPHPALGIQLPDKNGCRARRRGTRSSSTQVFTAQLLGCGFQERAVMCRQALQVRMEGCGWRAAEGVVGAPGDTALISGSLHQGDPRGPPALIVHKNNVRYEK